MLIIIHIIQKAIVTLAGVQNLSSGPTDFSIPGRSSWTDIYYYSMIHMFEFVLKSDSLIN